MNDLEHAVAVAEQASSLEAAADALRRDPIGLPGAVRWLRRRLICVRRCLVLVIGLRPDLLDGCAANIGDVRARLGQEWALVALRGLVTTELQHLPTPLGFYPVLRDDGDPTKARQQPMGPDPPGWIR